MIDLFVPLQLLMNVLAIDLKSPDDPKKKNWKFSLSLRISLSAFD